MFVFNWASLTYSLARGCISNYYLPVRGRKKAHPRVGWEWMGWEGVGCRLSPQRLAAGCGPGCARSSSETTAPSSARAESENKLQAALPPPPLRLPSSHMSFLFCFPSRRPAALRIRWTAGSRRSGRSRTGIPTPRRARGPRPDPAVKLSRFCPRLPHAGC